MISSLGQLHFKYVHRLWRLKPAQLGGQSSRLSGGWGWKGFICLGLSILLVAGCVGNQSSPKASWGTVLGAGLGGYGGGQIGNGNGRQASILVGGLVGGLTGNGIGESLDNLDRLMVAENRPNVRQSPLKSTNRSSLNRRQGPNRNIRNRISQFGGPLKCREYLQEIFIGDRPEVAVGIACEQSDGTWKKVR